MTDNEIISVYVDTLKQYEETIRRQKAEIEMLRRLLGVEVQPNRVEGA